MFLQTGRLFYAMHPLPGYRCAPYNFIIGRKRSASHVVIYKFTLWCSHHGAFNTPLNGESMIAMAKRDIGYIDYDNGASNGAVLRLLEFAILAKGACGLNQWREKFSGTYNVVSVLAFFVLFLDIVCNGVPTVAADW